MSDTRYPVYHKTSDDASIACGEIGLYTTVESPEVGDMLKASDFFRLNGNSFETGDKSICGHCEKPMEIVIENIDYNNPIEVEDHGS